MDMQSIVEVVSKIDVKLVVGVLSLGGVIYTVRKTVENVNNTNNLKVELEGQANNLKKELADQTNEITKELGEKNLKALEQRRYIDAISAERIKWINNLRDNFSDFLKNVTLQKGDIVKLANEKQNVDEDKMEERLSDMMYTGNHIFLLLNPTEPICKEIIKLQIEIVTALERFNDIEFDYDKVGDLVEDLVFLYQVVLKAEWKRVKVENEKGEEVDQETTNRIYKETSKKIDMELYNNFYSKRKEKAL